jgi:hypothetical protein
VSDNSERLPEHFRLVPRVLDRSEEINAIYAVPE